MGSTKSVNGTGSRKGDSGRGGEKGLGRRRLLLGVAAAATAGGVASVVRGPGAASALTGNLMFGQPNDAGGASTELDSSNVEWTFRAENGLAGAALLGVSGNGRGVHGNSTSGIGVKAETNSGTALLVKGPATFDGAVSVDGAVSATSFAGGGAGLTGLDASGLATGIVPDARLGANLARTSGATFSGKVTAPSFAGDGSGVTGLDARNIASGIVSRKRLPGLIAYRNARIAKFRGRLQAKGFGGVGGSAPAFSTAGTVTIKAGKDQVHVVAPALRNGASVLVNMQSNPGADVYVKWVFRGTGSFDVFLTGPVTAPTSLAYLVFKKG